MNDLQLSEHFTFLELTATDRPELQELNRRKALCYVGSLKELCRTVLEPIRLHDGRPVVVHSGFRCYELNMAIGGSANSQHLLGEAADFHIEGIELEEAFDWLWHESNIPFGQLIDEQRGGGRWLHISTGSRREVLALRDGAYARLA